METPSLQSSINPPQLTAATGAAHVSVRLMAPFLEAAFALGLRADAALARAGIGLAELDDPDALVSHSLAERLLSAAISSSGERNLGLLAAERLQPWHLDVIEYSARSQATLRVALELLIRYRALLHDQLESELLLYGDRGELRIGFGALNASDALREFVMAAHLVAARRMAAAPWLMPVEVHFRHARPRDSALHERIFGAGLHFGSNRDALIFMNAALDRELPPVSTDEPALASPLWLQRGGPNLVERVREIVRRNLSARDFGARSTAQRLEMSLRSLNRHLLGHRTSHRAIVDDVRRKLALRALTSTDLSIREIGSLIGFTTGPAFHRAFRRWTGATASSYRNDANRLRDLARARIGIADALIISCESGCAARRPAARRAR